MTLSRLLPALGLLCACRDGAPEPAPRRAPANVVLFTLDTTRADALSIYGNTVAKTPALAALAGEGTRFSRAFTVTPLTIPAHASIFTGLFPPRHGVRDNGDFFLADSAVTLAERLQAAGYATFASVGAEVTSHHWGFAQGFDEFDDDMGERPEGGRNRWAVERRGDAVVDDALAWLGQNGKGEKPFFSWIHLFDAHHPYRPPEPFATEFAQQPYLGEVSYLDSQVGRVVDWLKSNQHLDDTLIIAVGDHGEGLGSHGEAMHGVLVYNATTRVPLVIRPPGGQAEPGFVHFPVSLVDITPTVLSYAGLAAVEGIDGIDLRPWVQTRLDAAPDLEDRAVVAEALYGFHHYGWAPQRALITRQRKLIDGAKPQLYAREDLDEVRDLSATEPGGTAELSARIRAIYTAFVPSQGVAAQAEQSAERMAQLEALGYVSSSSEASGEGWDDGLPDPVEHLPSLREMERARGALQKGDLAEAETAARALLEHEPGLVEAQSLMANILARQGRIDEALAAFQAIDEAHPGSTPKAAMGTLLLQRGDFPGAVAQLSAALDIDPYLSTAWVAYLNALFLSGDLERLGEELARARQNVPTLPAVGAMDGVLRVTRGDFNGAEPLLRAALASDPLIPFVNLSLGLVASARELPNEAEAFFLEEISVAPPALAARRSLVTLYAGQKRYADQLAQLVEIARLAPTDVLTAHAIAQALHNLKRYPEALGAVDHCLDLTPNNAHCMMLKANVLGALGRKAEADAAYQAALKMAERAPGPPGQAAGSPPLPTGSVPAPRR